MRTCLYGEGHFISQAEMGEIHTAALEILAEVGIGLPHVGLLQRMADNGFPIDPVKQVVFFPAAKVEEAVARWRSRTSATQTDASLGGEPETTEQPTIIGGLSGSAAIALDVDSGLARPATVADLEDSIRLSNQLAFVPWASSLFTPQDVPPRTEDLYILEAILRLSSKPGDFHALYAANMPHMLEMHEVAHGAEEARRHSALGGRVFISSPLRYPPDALERAQMGLDLGFPPVFGAPMIVMGGTGPVTLAGSFALGTAEALSAAILTEICGGEPDFEIQPISMDQRTGMGCYADPRTLLAACAKMDIAEYYGFPRASVHVGLDASCPGIQAATERLFGTMLRLFLARGTPHVRLGVLGPSGASASLVQAMIDVEVFYMLDAYLQGIQVDGERIALDVIKRVGIGGTYLLEDHTLEHFREEMWAPTLFRRARDRPGKVATDDVPERAREELRRKLAAPDPHPLTEDQERELKKIVRRAAQHTKA